MLPMKARLCVKDHKGRGINLWLPLFLLWPILALLVLPFVLLYAVWRIFDRKRTPKISALLSAVFGFLSAARGLIVDVDDEDVKVKITIG